MISEDLLPTNICYRGNLSQESSMICILNTSKSQSKNPIDSPPALLFDRVVHDVKFGANGKKGDC